MIKILVTSIWLASCAMPISQYEIVDNSKSNLTDLWCARGECIEFTDTEIIFRANGEISTDTYKLKDNHLIESDIFGQWKEIGYSIVGDTLNLRIYDGYTTTHERFFRSK